tara:strand:+ start:5958 stop:6620 length:663 start_codon:yes stop_codon:yes gene_type:complete
MKIIKVYGVLKERLGGKGTFELDVFNAAEAIKALCANFPGLDKWFVDSSDDGIGYKVLLGNTEVGEENIENLIYPWSEKEVFHITPVVMGAIQLNPFKNKAIRNILIGAAIVGIAVFAPGIGLAATGGWGMSVAGITAGITAANSIALGAAVIGAGLIIGGIADIISPPPKAPPEAKKLQSFSFSGIEQTTTQGGAIPIVYGKCFVGSAVLSSGVDTFDA